MGFFIRLLFRAGVNKLLPKGQIQDALFLYSQWAENSFMFLNGWKKNQKKNYTLWHMKIIQNSNLRVQK